MSVASQPTREAQALDASTAQFLRAFEQGEPARSNEPPWLKLLRREAISRFAAAGFPTPRDEEWKYTNVAPLHGVSYETRPVARGEVTLAQLGEVALAGCDRFVSVDGRFAPELSTVEALPAGAAVHNLGDLWRDGAAVDPGLVDLVQQNLGRVVGPELSFAALNTALAVDGALVHLGRGVELARPLQLLHLSSGRGPRASFPRNLIVGGARSRAMVVETFAGLGGESYLVNAVTEVILGRGAVLDHVKLQLEAAGAFHVATVEARQAQRSDFRSFSFSLGGRLVRNDINTRFDDEGSVCSFHGLYLAGGEQHVDHHTVIDHRKPGCSSRESYKGILDGRATSVFNGKVFVREGAVRTDARQSNRNLLLSEDATVNTKPQLEIFADDVRCSHGATVGQLDEDALFYLRARGLSAADARRMLITAFASEIVAEVPHAALRELLEQRLGQRLLGDRLAAGPGERG